MPWTDDEWQLRISHSLFFCVSFTFTFLPQPRASCFTAVHKPILKKIVHLCSMVKHFKAFDSYYCCVTVTLVWQIQKILGSKISLSLFFYHTFLSKVWIWVLRQELHSSGVEGSQPVCLDPQGSLHFFSVVAQGPQQGKTCSYIIRQMLNTND